MKISNQRLRTTFALAMLGLLVMGGFAKEGAAQILSWGVDTFQAPPDPRWGPITVRDVEAAYRLLRDNHPGAPELHDLAFQEKLRTACAQARPHGYLLSRVPCCSHSLCREHGRQAHLGPPNFCGQYSSLGWNRPQQAR
jgi:hypothetical protein